MMRYREGISAVIGTLLLAESDAGHRARGWKKMAISLHMWLWVVDPRVATEPSHARSLTKEVIRLAQEAAGEHHDRDLAHLARDIVCRATYLQRLEELGIARNSPREFAHGWSPRNCVPTGE